jgi:outer membrane protein
MWEQQRGLSNAARVVIRWLLAASLTTGLGGCGTPHLKEKPRIRALTKGLNEIEAVSLQEQSLGKPVSVQEGLAAAAAEAAEPNRAVPTVTLTLEEVRAATLANNLDLKVDLIAPALARQTVDIERARFESIFSGSAEYASTNPATARAFSSQFYEASVTTPLHTGGAVITSVPIADTDGVSQAAASVAVIQSLLRGAGTEVTMYGLRVATYQQGSVDACTKLAAIALLADADVTYWRLYAARKALEVSRERYKLTENQLTFAHRMVEAGSAAKIEIVRAEADLAGSLDDVINAETVVRDWERNLKRIMNRPDLPLHSNVSLIPATDPAPKGLKLDAEALAAAAVQNRLEMIDLELRLAINDADIALAKNNTLPQLDLSYSYAAGGEAHTTSRAFENVFDRPSQEHAVTLSAAIPLGNRAARARLRQTRLEKIRTQVDRERQSQWIRQEVYEVVDALEQNWRRILAAEQGVGQAYRQYKVEQSQFQLGQRTSTDVLLAASNLANAQLRRISAFADYEVAQVRLAQATGTILGRAAVQLQPVTLAAE